MYNYADFIDFLSQILTKQWGSQRWTADFDGATATGETERESIEKLLETLTERGSL